LVAFLSFMGEDVSWRGPSFDLGKADDLPFFSKTVGSDAGCSLDPCKRDDLRFSSEMVDSDAPLLGLRAPRWRLDIHCTGCVSSLEGPMAGKLG
jgi:hypothetical protein